MIFFYMVNSMRIMDLFFFDEKFYVVLFDFDGVLIFIVFIYMCVW